MNKPYKILFDANPLVNGNKSGVGYYTSGIIQALADTYPDDIQLVGHYFSFLGKKGKVQLPQAPNIRYRKSRILPGKILSATRKFGFQPPLELFFKEKGDVAIFTNFVSLPTVTNTPTIVAVHDLCFVEVPKYVATKNRKFLQKFVPKSIERSRAVITISEATGNAIKSHYKTPEDKIIITPVPPGRRTQSSKMTLNSLLIKKDYILFVSTLEPRKNILNLVKAYEDLDENLRSKYELVLAGGEGWYIEETLAYIAKLQADGLAIRITGYVSDDQRAALYENASLFVFPSHYEGFGMPILEAMNYGVPCVVSDIPVFHEVAGNAALYFDKDKPADIAKTISNVLVDNKIRGKLINRGNYRATQLNWDNVAQTIYEKIKAI